MSVLDAVEDVKSRSGTPDEVPTVPTSSNPEENVCPICHEEFDQFYKQDFTDIAAAEGKRSNPRIDQQKLNFLMDIVFI